jgi:hypothetical protein
VIYIYYWCGKPYDLKVTLVNWEDKEINGNEYSLINKFMNNKELYKRIDVSITTWDSENINIGTGTVTFLSFRNIKDKGIIKLNDKNIKKRIINVLESKYINAYDVELRKILFNNKLQED